MKPGMGSHQSHKMLNDEWLTPPSLIENLGTFTTDPCSPIDRPWDTAQFHYSIEDNGLSLGWPGRVWCNPPYGSRTGEWLDKLAKHGNGIALIFARTETKMFFDQVWDKADALLFIKGRLFFHYVDGSRARTNAGAPSVLVAYGLNNAQVLKECSIDGKFIRL